MTTIAYKDGVLAADSRATNNGVVTGQCTKIWTGRVGRYAGCGEACYVFPLREWLDKSTDDRGTQPDKGCIIAFDEGRIYEDGGWRPINEAPFHAFGSGKEIALGAMAMGASAEQAVEVATRFDIYSGGEITVLRA